MLEDIFTGWGSTRMGGTGAAEVAATRADAAAQRVQSLTAELRGEMERLFIVTEALWEMLRETHGWTEEQLVARITEIDMRDGRRDGAVARQPPPACAKCGRPAPLKRPRCLFCGEVHPVRPFAR